MPDSVVSGLRCILSYLQYLARIQSASGMFATPSPLDILKHGPVLE